MSRVEVLMSCMHEKDWSLVQTSNVCSDIVLVNQCDRDEKQAFTFTDQQGQQHQGQFVCSTRRGLSVSRNTAIEHAQSEFCLIADDDELFTSDYDEQIAKTFDQHSDCDVIAFHIDGSTMRTPSQACRIGYLKALRISSLQIAFRRESIVKAGIRFDEQMGSGTGHGAGEEEKFLYDCLRKGLRIHYVPITIATLQDRNPSQWFKGFDARYFFNRGWATRRFMGWPMATLYSFYFTFAKRKRFQGQMTAISALKLMLKGIRHKEYPKDLQL